jgi:glycosyltransferase involved in cell wall biosynthesis
MATSGTPTVSILLPAYNRAKMLRRAIESIFRQSYQDWELIVIDDASKDETPEVLKEYAQKDPRVTFIRNEKDLFTTACLNEGLAVAHGEFIARLDDDDYWLDEDKLKKQVEFLGTHPDYVVVGSGMVVVNVEDKELFRYLKKETDEEIRKSALFANPFSHTTVMFRTAAARAVGGYGNERYAEDWGLWLELGKRGKFYNFPEYFTAYTRHNKNGSFVYQRQQSKRVLELITAARRDYPGFWKAYLLNGTQYLYSYLPSSMRKAMHSWLISIKRRLF